MAGLNNLSIANISPPEGGGAFSNVLDIPKNPVETLHSLEEAAGDQVRKKVEQLIQDLTKRRNRWTFPNMRNVVESKLNKLAHELVSNTEGSWFALRKQQLGESFSGKKRKAQALSEAREMLQMGMQKVSEKYEQMKKGSQLLANDAKWYQWSTILQNRFHQFGAYKHSRKLAPVAEMVAKNIEKNEARVATVREIFSAVQKVLGVTEHQLVLLLNNNRISQGQTVFNKVTINGKKYDLNEFLKTFPSDMQNKINVFIKKLQSPEALPYIQKKALALRSQQQKEVSQTEELLKNTAVENEVLLGKIPYKVVYKRSDGLIVLVSADNTAKPVVYNPNADAHRFRNIDNTVLIKSTEIEVLKSNAIKKLEAERDSKMIELQQLGNGNTNVFSLWGGNRNNTTNIARMQSLQASISEINNKIESMKQTGVLPDNIFQQLPTAA